ncbi:DNA-binding protein [Escherichia coli]|nr:DNA-binding protein [Shigella dysenteriae]EJY6562771.1 DNA-binding protein [Escherichia coli]HAY5914309.1 DNA-binding protein [Shigella dysenteriae]
MSIDALRWAKKVKTGSSSSKSVLTWLADMCGADLCAYPSVSALAEVTELNKKTVQDSLRHLMEIGLIVDTGERKGRTKQIVVYRLIGVEESVAEPEYTQKRESLKVGKIGAVNKNSTENGYVSAQNRPKNGSRNPKEPKDLNPTHNARESAPTSEQEVLSLQAAPLVFLDGLSEPIGKYPMTDSWYPSRDFRRRAALWGMALPETEFTPAELAAFRDYWAAEGKVFTQIQWEQKFARHVNHVRAQVKPVSKGVNHAAAPGGTASRAVQEIRAAREQWERENGFISDGNGLEAVGTHGGGLFEPLDPEERGRTFEALDCTDWRDD